MNNFIINIQIEDSRWQQAIANLEAAVNEAKDRAAARVRDEIGFLDSSREFSLNLCLSNDETVRKLNSEFRQADKPTNVLSFAAIDDVCFQETLAAGQEVELGDVIMAYETMEREAGEQEISMRDHFCHLWVHGLLHILGYDHADPEDAREMEQRETEILAAMGIDNPYRE